MTLDAHRVTFTVTSNPDIATDVGSPGCWFASWNIVGMRGNRTVEATGRHTLR